MTRENAAEPQEQPRTDDTSAAPNAAGQHAVLVVPRSFSFEVLPDVAERVQERTRKYLQLRESQKKAAK